MIRNLKPIEINLIRDLTQGKIQDIILYKLNDRLVNDLINDGLSIEFFVNKKDHKKIKQEISAVFYDDDGVPITVDISIDYLGDLYDMDIWKADGTLIVKGHF